MSEGFKPIPLSESNELKENNIILTKRNDVSNRRIENGKEVEKIYREQLVMNGTLPMALNNVILKINNGFSSVNSETAEQFHSKSKSSLCIQTQSISEFSSKKGNWIQKRAIIYSGSTEISSLLSKLEESAKASVAVKSTTLSKTNSHTENEKELIKENFVSKLDTVTDAFFIRNYKITPIDNDFDNGRIKYSIDFEQFIPTKE